MKLLILLLITTLCGIHAHDFAVEKQRVRKANRHNPGLPVGPDEDYSFEYPADVIDASKPLLSVTIPAFGPPFIPVYGDERPKLGMVFNSMLYHQKHRRFMRPISSDVDWYKIDLTNQDVTDLKLIFYATPPYCELHRYFTPSFGLVGRMNVTDSHGNAIFSRNENVPFNLPEGYGILVKRHPRVRRNTRRNYYCSPHSAGCIFLPEGVVDSGCTEGYEDLEQTNIDRLAQGLEPCSDDHIIRVDIDTQDVYYGVVWDDSYRRRRHLENDYAFIYGYKEPTQGTNEEKQSFWTKVIETDLYRYNNVHLSHDCFHPYPEDGLPYPTPHE